MQALIRILLLLGLLLFLAQRLTAQAVVETAVAASAATGAAAGVKPLGKALQGAFGKAGTAAASKSASPGRAGQVSLLETKPRQSEPPPAPAARTLFADVEPGLARKELLAKLGKPFFAITQSQQGALVEVLTWRIEDGGTADVRLSAGKVAAAPVFRDAPEKP